MLSKNNVELKPQGNQKEAKQVQNEWINKENSDTNLDIMH